MEKDKYIQELLRKYIRNECSQKELQEIINFFQKKDSISQFPNLEEVMEMMPEKAEMDDRTTDRLFETILSVSKERDFKPQNSYWGKKKFYKYAAVAAIFIAFLCLNFFYDLPISFTKVNSDVNIPESLITLQLEDGSVKILEEGEQLVLVDEQGNFLGSQDKNQLVYKPKRQTEEVKFNTLRVPYGKRFEIELSDGTHVHLNSGTSFRYPVQFIPGKIREVYLSGEAFFDVAKDTEHPFIVNSENLNIKVLGTRFNVASYKEDSRADIVLVEGSVGMYPDGENLQSEHSLMLVPGTKGSFNKSELSLTKKKVITSVYTSWIKGELVFRNMTFKNILKKLERHYNIEIDNRNEILENETFNANFGNEPIEKVMEYLKTMYGIKYSIKNDKIIIE
ncbi:DUF4974 domain-containing protein [Gillisia sp. M10.2A]|uniref:DUF4974 domain-containing protein n=1 Tax=Gillisia lutea TaxID=2909668 RepID=A0ABS9ED22_9FLAO|nr:FecR family protein [Gillisia lutea]MCF4100776.1 DUF4974 domain-containing protein [Gillisia lutea]